MQQKESTLLDSIVPLWIGPLRKELRICIELSLKSYSSAY